MKPHFRNQLSSHVPAALITAGVVLFSQTNTAAKPPTAPPAVQLTVLGTYASGIFNAGGSEIAAHDPLMQRLYVVNAQDASVNVLDITFPETPVLVGTISL